MPTLRLTISEKELTITGRSEEMLLIDAAGALIAYLFRLCEAEGSPRTTDQLTEACSNKALDFLDMEDAGEIVLPGFSIPPTRNAK